MSTHSSAHELSFLFRPQREPRPVMLLGAGASYRSGIPLADEAVRRIARAAYARQIKGLDFREYDPKRSDWLPFLERQDWFVSDPARLAERFSAAVQHLLTPREFRREFFLDMIDPPNGINDGYQHLAAIMMRRLCGTVLTTNFDSLIVDVLREKQPHVRNISIVHDQQHATFGVYNPFQIVYLHGDVGLYTDKNLESETTRLNNALVTKLRPLLRDSPLVVVGYRGTEPSVMEHLLADGVQECNGYRHGIFWCNKRGDRLSDGVGRFQQIVGSNLRVLEIDGFDELMEELASILDSDAAYSEAPRAARGRGHVNYFDEEPVPDLTIEHLDHDLVLATLNQYCHRLHLPPLAADTLTAFLAEQGLLVEIEGVLRPTVGCYLLFGKDVTTRYPQTAISLTTDGKGRRLLTGNLTELYHGLREYFADHLNPVIRLKTNQGSQERDAYPPRVLLELGVNLLAHRDYSQETPSHIDALPGHLVSFHNPGGLPPEVHKVVDVRENNTFTPVRNVTGIRNPSIADIFYGLGPMDKAGSGLADVQELMLEAGGIAEFAIGAANDSVKVTVLQARQSSTGSVSVARKRSPVGTYVTNILPFQVFPDEVVTVPCKSVPREGLTSVFEGIPSRELPVFIHHDQTLITFASHDRMKSIGSGIGRLGTPTTESLIDFVTDEQRRNLIVWLLGKHVRFFLNQFTEDGILVDHWKKRAYFRLVTGSRNTITYDSAKRRGIRRDVVKRRGQGQSIWYENEGIWYAVVRMDDTWGVQLKPFYMFTGRDGTAPLPSLIRTRRSVRRMKFDRNRNVDDDLSFWSRYLSSGSPVINLDSHDSCDLILASLYCSVEVPEPAERPGGPLET